MAEIPYKVQVKLPAAVKTSGWVPTADREELVLAEAIASGKVIPITRGKSR